MSCGFSPAGTEPCSMKTSIFEANVLASALTIVGSMGLMPGTAPSSESGLGRPARPSGPWQEAQYAPKPTWPRSALPVRFTALPDPPSLDGRAGSAVGALAGAGVSVGSGGIGVAVGSAATFWYERRKATTLAT